MDSGVNKTKKQTFLEGFDNPKNEFVYAYVKMPDCPKLEEIRNPKENFKAKKDYYDRAYDDDLKLKSCPTISIEKWIFTVRGK